MPNTLYPDSPDAIRDDLAAAHGRALDWIARPGTWLDGKRRIAIVAEARNALSCAHCDTLVEALSPYAVTGEHASLGALTVDEVDLVHRIVRDPGRLTESWARERAEAVGELAYVEITGLVAMTMIMDTFTRGLGLRSRDLSVPQPGEPTRYRPPGARRQAAWLPIVEPTDTVPEDGPLYPAPKVGYIQRALTAVPDAKRAYWDLAEAHYLKSTDVYDFTGARRAIARPQIEILAARVSALHQCVY